MSKQRMYGSKNPRGSVAVMLLVIFTIGMLSSLIPGKQDSFSVAMTAITYLLLLGAEGVLFCRVHYGESPMQVLQRARTETDA